MREMHALVDASWLEAQYAIGGIARMIVSLYEQTIKICPSMRATFLHRRPLVRRPPSSVTTLHWGRIKWKRPWRALALPVAERYLCPSFVHFPGNGEIPCLWPTAKVVTTMHDVLPMEIPNYFRNEQRFEQYVRYTQRDIDRTDVLFTDSHYSKSKIMEYFRVKHEPIVLYLASDYATRNPQSSQHMTRDGDYFLYTGVYRPRKKLDELVSVYSELYRQGRVRSRLVLTGEVQPISPSFRAKVDEGKAQGFIEELGQVSDERLADLIAGAKCLVYPSKHEGFGLPILEGMALGCPVLTTPCTSIPEVGGDAVLYVDPDDPEDLARGLVEMETNTDLRRSLVQRGYAQAAHFSWQRTAEQFLCAVDRMCCQQE